MDASGVDEIKLFLYGVDFKNTSESSDLVRAPAVDAVFAMIPTKLFSDAKNLQEIWVNHGV